jgi:hypothetical protein
MEKSQSRDKCSDSTKCSRSISISCCNERFCYLHVFTSKHAQHPKMWKIIDQIVYLEDKEEVDVLFSSVVLEIERELDKEPLRDDEVFTKSSPQALKSSPPKMTFAELKKREKSVVESVDILDYNDNAAASTRFKSHGSSTSIWASSISTTSPSIENDVSERVNHSAASPVPIASSSSTNVSPPAGEMSRRNHVVDMLVRVIHKSVASEFSKKNQVHSDRGNVVEFLAMREATNPVSMSQIHLVVVALEKTIFDKYGQGEESMVYRERIRAFMYAFQHNLQLCLDLVYATKTPFEIATLPIESLASEEEQLRVKSLMTSSDVMLLDSQLVWFPSNQTCPSCGDSNTEYRSTTMQIDSRKSEIWGTSSESPEKTYRCKECGSSW